MGKREEAELREAFGSDNSVSSCLIGSVAPASLAKNGTPYPEMLIAKIGGLRQSQAVATGLCAVGLEKAEHSPVQTVEPVLF